MEGFFLTFREMGQVNGLLWSNSSVCIWHIQDVLFYATLLLHVCSRITILGCSQVRLLLEARNRVEITLAIAHLPLHLGQAVHRLPWQSGSTATTSDSTRRQHRRRGELRAANLIHIYLLSERLLFYSAGSVGQSILTHFAAGRPPTVKEVPIGIVQAANRAATPPRSAIDTWTEWARSPDRTCANWPHQRPSPAPAKSLVHPMRAEHNYRLN